MPGAFDPRAIIAATPRLGPGIGKQMIRLLPEAYHFNISKYMRQRTPTSCVAEKVDSLISPSFSTFVTCCTNMRRGLRFLIT
jgi:hypothetical protein